MLPRHCYLIVLIFFIAIIIFTNVLTNKLTVFTFDTTDLVLIPSVLIYSLQLCYFNTQKQLLMKSIDKSRNGSRAGVIQFMIASHVCTTIHEMAIMFS